MKAGDQYKLILLSKGVNMLSNDYIPQYYRQMQQSSTNIIWVQGESAAKAYPVMPGQSVILMDSEATLMYIKSTDQSGMPLPLRIFKYNEMTQNGNPAPQAESKNEFISREEFDKFREEIKTEIRRAKRKDEPARDMKVA
jgi:hypothetical protein